MSDAKYHTTTLCGLLTTAAEKLAAIRGPIWSSYTSGEEIAEVVLKCKAGIENGTIDSAQKRALWSIFAPTCDWDDVVGDSVLGQEIFDQLDRLFGHEIRGSTP